MLCTVAVCGDALRLLGLMLLGARTTQCVPRQAMQGSDLCVVDLTATKINDDSVPAAKDVCMPQLIGNYTIMKDRHMRFEVSCLLDATGLHYTGRGGELNNARMEISTPWQLQHLANIYLTPADRRALFIGKPLRCLLRSLSIRYSAASANVPVTMSQT